MQSIGHGRNEDHSSPPVQIRACGFPAPGSCLRSDVIGIRGMGYPCSSDPWARCFSDMLVPALCPEHASQRALPLTGRLPSTVSATDTNSALFEASSVLCSHPTPHPRACPSYGCCLHGPVRCFGRTRVRSPRFRAKDVFHVHGVYDSARLLLRKPLRGEDVAFRPAERRQHLEIRPVSLLNTQPVVTPVNASS